MPTPADAAPPRTSGPVVPVGETLEQLLGDGEAIWPGATVLVADVPVARAAAADWLPPGLRLPEVPRARVFVADYPSTTFGIAYREVGVLLHALTARRHEAVLHCCSMVVDDDSAMILGRELFGFPKKLAAIALEVTTEPGGAVSARVVRRGQQLLRIDGTVGDAIDTPTALLDRPIVNVWGLPGPLPAVLLRMAPPEHVHAGHAVHLRVRLIGGDHDPLAALGVTDVEVDGQLLHTDLATPPGGGAGSRPGLRDLTGFVTPLRPVGSRWMARHYLARTR